MKDITQLDVYRLSEELSDLVWNSYDNWPQKVKQTIGYQIIRASDSIAANLAEGYGRYTPADRKRFYLFSRCSFEETNTWLRKVIRRDILTKTEIHAFTSIIDELGPKLNAFIKSTK